MNSVPRAVQLMEIGAANATDASSPSCRLRASRWASRNGLSSGPPPDARNFGWKGIWPCANPANSNISDMSIEKTDGG